MIIIQKGTTGEQGKNKTCPNCKSKLLYFEADKKTDRDSTFIKCGVCSHLITV